ncbi:uncharacterized protein mute [Hetaerina americana]|uniref:uncharacterized protein mute n=1 Tax=Hetaerina americana TaxID=62018 RepID=UPI003A7F1026
MDVGQDSELDSEDDASHRNTNWNDNESVSEESFTLNLNVYEDDVYKGDSSATELIIASNEEVTEKCDEIRETRRISFDEDMPVAFEDMEDEIERQLDAKAAKSNLSVSNVKNILKSVITNEDVMAMVRHSMLNDGDGSWLTYEPKLTRAKAKELMKAQPEMTQQLFTPTKKQSECQILIEKELSEDSSDDEYKPLEDEFEQSEDEKSSVADSLSSPVRKVTTPTFLLSPEIRSMDGKDEDTVTNVECGTQTCWSEDGLFKIPQVRQELAEKSEQENIGQRTRSKLSLNNTPLEVIESAFVPPDITTDMYDSDCDDEEWTAFLKDFALNNGDSENVDDDDVADPEYNVLADFDNQTVDEEELRVDKAVKISRKEKKVLMAEAHEPLFSDDDDFDLLKFFPSMETSDSQHLQQLTEHSLEAIEQNWESAQPNKNTSVNESLTANYGGPTRNENVEETGCIEPLSPPQSPEYLVPEINATQLAIFKQQMRQYVQILTQNFLQLSCHPNLSHRAESCKSLLVNLQCLSMYKKKSNFEAENLNAAIELVNEWEKRLETNPQEKIETQNFIKSELSKRDAFKRQKKHYAEKLPKNLMDFMASSKVFLYPQLLPQAIFRCDKLDRTLYLAPEEQLIALGLEQFVPYFESQEDLTKSEVLDKVVCLLHQLLLPFRTYAHTKRFIIQAKYNPHKQIGAINYYFENGKAPETHHYVFPLKWEKALCPKRISKGNLPENWARHIHGFSKDEEMCLRYKKRRAKRKWSKRFAIPVLLIGEFPDFKTAKKFGDGTLDYTGLAGKVFKMLPSMPLISNINKDIIENPSSNVKLPNVVFSVGGVERSTQTRKHQSAMSLPLLTSPVSTSSKKASPLKQVTPILKKYNCHRKGKGGNVIKGIGSSCEKGIETSRGKASPRHIAPKPVVVFVPTKEINFPDIVATEPLDSSNTQREIEVNAPAPQNTSDGNVGENIESSPAHPDSIRNTCPSVNQSCGVIEGVQESSLDSGGNSITAPGKKDNEDELAALMLASSTIRGPTANLERKRKSKQQRDTDAKLALLSPEKGSATEERDYIFAHAFFKKLEVRLKNGTEEGSSSFETLVHTLNELSEEKPSHEVENLLKQILRILGPHRDLLEEFSCFLNSKQALHHGCLASHLSGIQMRDFIHKLEVYFAKQPNHVHKIMDAISDLSNRPNISLEEIKEEIVPLLKGNLILLHKLLQLLPTERPLDSLMTDFEELEFGEDMDLNGDHEPVENVRLPDKELGDRFGGEGCACPCHSVPPLCAPQSEKESSRSSHCNRCGLKFVNGRVILQTAKGIRPAKVIFDSPADFQRVVVKDVVQPPRLNKGRARKKSKTSENKDESSSPPPKIQILQGVESEEDISTTRISDLSSSPRGSQSRAGGKGTRGVSTKGKDTKVASMPQKSISSEPSHSGDSCVSQKSSMSCGSDSKELSSTTGNNKNSCDIQSRISKDGILRPSGKNIDKPDTYCNQESETQRNPLDCSNVVTESSPKNDISNSSYEPGDINMDEIPWTREEDRIILQTFQADGGKRDALVKIRQKLPGRSVAEIASRFQKLMSLFRKMTGPTTGMEEEDISIEKGMSDNN